jgi:ribosomal protein L37E
VTDPNANSGSDHAWVGWRCIRCGHEMRHNLRCCTQCGYTKHEPIKAYERPDWAGERS